MSFLLETDIGISSGKLVFLNVQHITIIEKSELIFH